MSRLDNPEQAVEQAEALITSVEVHPLPRASTPVPTPVLRTSVPAASGESESGEDYRSLPLMSPRNMIPPQYGAQSRLSARLVGQRSRLQSSGDVSLMDVISRMKALELEGYVAPKTTKGAGRSGRENVSSGDSWSE